MRTVGAGLGQTAAIWAAVVIVALSVPDGAVALTGVLVGLLACVVLGVWHRRRARADSAVGAFAGVVLWPVLIGATLIAINIAVYE
ncbi:hypothetical protein [Paractinoplanes atraurantiacus]|uniref:Uncharacterized protein n=1 Tax=Paractinoplanes atraurantiacus TaxID=1036182 RepID=A0A285I3T3_9ACTN|nr:hypothetical protein [Actinoplanes atraurantiacus]SNY42604.1 hypothetical protein SAMN05421748_106311 [Actinoplanes atraurantiacus]